MKRAIRKWQFMRALLAATLLLSTGTRSYAQTLRTLDCTPEIRLTRFEEGAWLPGRNVRYLRVHSAANSASALRLRRIEIWAQ